MRGQQQRISGFVLATVLSLVIVLANAPLIISLDRNWLDRLVSLIQERAPAADSSELVVLGIDERTVDLFPEPIALWHSHISTVLDASKPQELLL